MNPLRQLHEVGQSPWYDYIRRGLMSTGTLQTLIQEDGLMGMTSNPAIFENAIAGSEDYEEDLKRLARERIGVKDIYERLAIRDIQDAADLMMPVYERTAGRDGYVSLEVSPDLAFHTEQTIQEAQRLFQTVGRKNVMIKVPGTAEGLPAIEELLGQGININVTLLFSVERYEQVARSYVRGLKKLEERGGDLKSVSSVASFFVSRIDTLVDQRLDSKIAQESDGARRSMMEGLKGQVAIANAKLAYHRFQHIFSEPEFQPLKKQGARVQRVLWASTGTKNPHYPDTYYVNSLIGPDTVNTMPEATFGAFRDHGTVESTLQHGMEEARQVMADLSTIGISIEEVTDTLLKDGAKLFVKAFDKLLGTIQQKRVDVLGSEMDRVTYALGSFQGTLDETLRNLQDRDVVRRIWAKDPSVWHEDPAHQSLIQQALGWLTIIEEQIPMLSQLQSVARDVQDAGFRHVLLLGMGGSSLCPEVLRMTFGILGNFPELHVLDSTVPSQVRSFEQRVDLTKTLCVVASKSGSTTEPLVFQKYFFDRMRQAVGDNAGAHFVAITDPGSLLEQLAKEQKFRHTLHGVPEIGGRYSALSNFGVVPAALMGVDIEEFLLRAQRMRESCDAGVPAFANLGVKLGAALGCLAKDGRDKMTVIASPVLWDFGAWLEQLLAESTGKEGKGIIPVDDESLGAPEMYGQDRVFVYIRYAEGVDSTQDMQVAALEQAGHPVIRIDMADLMNLGQEFFLWEMATAVAGAILEINAFDQPNVQESKDYTKAYLDTFKKTGSLPVDSPIVTEDHLQLYADDKSQLHLQGKNTLGEIVAAHVGQLHVGDYLAINAYVERTEAVHTILSRIREKVRNAKKVATTLGYGPRFLHSTGQLHKGGPNSGVFVQLTCEDDPDVPIPGEPYSFGILKAAQALGDLQSLTTRNRRVIRVHLGKNVAEDVARLEQAIDAALKNPAQVQ